MQFAIIENGIVQNIIEGDATDPSFSAAFPDAVELKAPGGVGSSYDPATGTFGNPPAPSAPTDRWVSSTEFEFRIPQQKRVAIRGSADANVQDFIKLVEMSPQVNVLDPRVIGAVDYMVSVNLLTSSDAQALLA